MENFIKNISKISGDELLKNFNKEKDLISLRQNSKEVVTKYDKEIDSLIIKEIEKKYPEHNILAEESGLKDNGSDYLWIIDSLDGSGNFANKNPLFSVCIALLFKNNLILGVTYAPAIDEFYFAKKGEGAFLNKKRIKVSETKNLKNSYIYFCDGHEKDKDKLSKDLSLVFKNVIDLRKIGSAGVETGWVASGRADGFLIFKGDPWDLASGVLIIEEAGGKVSSFKNEPWVIKEGSYIFSNNKIHKNLINLLNY